MSWDFFSRFFDFIKVFYVAWWTTVDNRLFQTQRRERKKLAVDKFFPALLSPSHHSKNRLKNCGIQNRKRWINNLILELYMAFGDREMVRRPHLRSHKKWCQSRDWLLSKWKPAHFQVAIIWTNLKQPVIFREVLAVPCSLAWDKTHALPVLGECPWSKKWERGGKGWFLYEVNSGGIEWLIRQCTAGSKSCRRELCLC